MIEPSNSMAAEPLKTFRHLMTFKLDRLGGQSERFFERHYRQLFDLSRPECRVIGFTGDVGTVAFKQVCEALNIDKSFASRIINQLVERGILRKEGNPDDQRSVLISLTAEGRKLHHDLHATTVSLNQRMLEALSPEQASIFMDCLQRLHERLNELDDARHGDDAKANGTAREGGGGGSPRQQVVVDLSLARQLHHALGRLIGQGD